MKTVAAVAVLALVYRFGGSAWNYATSQLSKLPVILGRLDFANAIVGPLIVLLITSLWKYIQAKRELDARDQDVDAALERYVQDLERQIFYAKVMGPLLVVSNAKSIVIARDNHRATLTALSNSMNSEIDDLAIALGAEYSRAPQLAYLRTQFDPQKQASAEEIYAAVNVLHLAWPTKKEAIKAALRRVLFELGYAARPPRRWR